MARSSTLLALLAIAAAVAACVPGAHAARQLLVDQSATQAAAYVTRTESVTGVTGVTGVNGVTAETLVANLRALTAKSQSMQSTANSITVLSPSLFLIGQGPLAGVYRGLLDIVGDTSSYLQNLYGTAPFSSAEQQAIFERAREFVRVHTTLLNILIGKAQFVVMSPLVCPPLASALQNVKDILESYFAELINVSKDMKEPLTEQQKSLSSTSDLAVKSYIPMSLIAAVV